MNTTRDYTLDLFERNWLDRRSFYAYSVSWNWRRVSDFCYGLFYLFCTDY